MTRNRPNVHTGRSGEAKKPPRQKRGFHLAGLLVFLALLLLLAAMLLLRWRSDSPDGIRGDTQGGNSDVTETQPEATAAPEQNTPGIPVPAVSSAVPAASGTEQNAAGNPLTTPPPDTSPLPAGIETVPTAGGAAGSESKTYDEHTYQLVTDIIYTMRNRGEEEEPSIRALLEELKAADPALGTMWEGIADYWFYVCRDFTVNPGRLPDGLPEDDSLGIVVLGFQLMGDGEMAPELIGRCETALACAAQYPNAYLIVTGGGTASGNRSATEADVMASWLEEHGIGKEKIIIENRSLTTDQNASNTCSILAEQHPEIRSLAMVSSDYHVAQGSMLFTEAALLYAYEHDCEVPYQVISNAGYATSGNPIYSNPRMFPSDMWILADPHY